MGCWCRAVLPCGRACCSHADSSASSSGFGVRGIVRRALLPASTSTLRRRLRLALRDCERLLTACSAPHGGGGGGGARGLGIDHGAALGSPTLLAPRVPSFLPAALVRQLSSSSLNSAGGGGGGGGAPGRARGASGGAPGSPGAGGGGGGGAFTFSSPRADAGFADDDAALFPGLSDAEVGMYAAARGCCSSCVDIAVATRSQVSGVRLDSCRRTRGVPARGWDGRCVRV